MPGPDLLTDDQVVPVPVPDVHGTDVAVRARTDDPPPDGAGAHHVRRRAPRSSQAAVLALPVLVLAVLGWTHRSMFFDGYIYLHVVQNVLAGHGPVFNAGQRVEAFTSPLWLGILSVAGLVTPLPLTSIAVDLGLVCSVAGLGLATAASTRLVRRAAPDAFLLPLGAVVFVAVAPVWSLATLGLETGLEFLWLGACLWILVRWAGATGREVPWPAMVVLGLGPLVRPELVLDTLVFVGVVLVVDPGRRGLAHRAWVVTCAFALPLAYEVFRMGYYGMLVANTAVAKEASLPRPGEGVRYLTDFVTPYWLVVPAAALVLGAFLPLSAALRDRPGATRNRVALLALPTAAALNAGYITVMGGDYVHGRLLMAPFFAACAPVAAVPLARRSAIALAVVPWALVCAVSLRSADNSPWSSSPFMVVNGYGTADPAPYAWGTPADRSAWLSPSGTYLQEDPTTAPTRLSTAPAPGLATPTVATYWIGQGPYELGTSVHVLDLLGLADPLAGHLQLLRRGAFPGHEKPLPTPWVAALVTAPGTSPAQLATLQKKRPGEYSPLIADTSGEVLAVQTAWARAALTCPTVHALEFGPDRPLSVSVFVSDLFHAPATTTLRVPADPETAYHRFCGPGTPASVRAAGG